MDADVWKEILQWSHALVVAPLALFLWWVARQWVTAKNKDDDEFRRELVRLDSAVAELKSGQVDQGVLWQKVDDLKDRLTRIEANIPNGELRTLLYRFSSLESRLDENLVMLRESFKQNSMEHKEWKLSTDELRQRTARNEDRIEQILERLPRP